MTTIELQNKVVAVFDSSETASAASAAVSGMGHHVEVLEGEDGRARLPQNQEGVKGAIKTAVAAFGDELRILVGLDEALAERAKVLIVDVPSNEADKVVAELDRHQGRFVWSFGEWTFKAAASENDEDDNA